MTIEHGDQRIEFMRQMGYAQISFMEKRLTAIVNLSDLRLLLRRCLLGVLLGLLSGCASMISQGLAGDLQAGIANQDDPTIVKDGAPAYMLLIDGNIQNKPDDRGLLLAGARLYTIYASVFVEDQPRARRLTARALDYARRAICLARPALCQLHADDFNGFVASINKTQGDDIDFLYTYATAWAAWVIANKDDWNALADLPKIEVLLKRVVSLDDGYAHGMPHVYLGILDTRLPANLGGKPEQGRARFEHAIKLSNGRNLIAKVELARRYARLVFDRPLHDRLLNEVIKADPHEPDLTLSNVLAQQQAQQLLKSAAEYF